MTDANTLVMVWVVPGIITGILAGIWLYLYLRYGLEPVPETAPGRAAGPPCPWTPVELGMLLNWGRLRPRDMTASMLDLVRRGALRLTAERNTATEIGGLAVERGRPRSVELTPAERYLIDEVIFHFAPGADRASLYEVMVEGARDFTETCGRVDEWREMAEGEPMPFAFEADRSRRMSQAGVLVGLAMLICAYVIATVFESPVAILALIAGALMIPGSRAIRKRTREAVEALAQWQAYRDCLAQQSSSMGDAARSAGPEDLVYAVTLGVARDVIERFQMLYPTRQNIADSPRLYAVALAPPSDLFTRAFTGLISTRGPSDDRRDPT
jgi:hypothetical protein